MADPALFEYLLRLGDDALVLGHRHSEWCGRAPMLAEELALATLALDLIGPQQGLVEPSHQRGNGVRRVQTLIRVHVPGKICIGRHLPPAQVNRFQTSLDLLHCLVPSQCTQGCYIWLSMQKIP